MTKSEGTWFAIALAAALSGSCSGSGSSQAIPEAGTDAPSSSSSGLTSIDASGTGPSPNATTYFISVLILQGPCSGNACQCLPQPLPADATGQVPCQIFFQLASGDTCSIHGLPPATSDVLASIVARQGGAHGPICVLPQLPTADWVNGSCATSSQAGWCYVTGASAGHCPQRIVTSPAGLTPTGDVAILGCGETATPAAPQGTSVASVGVACVPSLELSASFGGFYYREVTLDENNPACHGDVCLVNHFQGLTSCPYGQDSNGTPPPGASCSVPATATPVTPNAASGGQTVAPWCADRLADNAVYCSCRCQNAEGRTSDGASYCTCPSGYTCSQVVPAIQSGDPRAGGYCIKSGTSYDSNTACATECRPSASPCP